MYEIIFMNEETMVKHQRVPVETNKTLNDKMSLRMIQVKPCIDITLTG